MMFSFLRRPDSAILPAMREIVFDTETTGLFCNGGDRLIELGCVEVLNGIPTGRTFHAYLNPKRSISPEAVQVHGLTETFLADKPCFEDVADAFSEFVGDSPLIAHNCEFDRGFINMELQRCGRPTIPEFRFVDTLSLARRRNPNGPNSLDALCARFGIDCSRRTKHGALLDAELLAEVYIELIGGRQATFALGPASTAAAAARSAGAQRIPPRPRPLPSRLTPSDIAAHRLFILEMSKAPLWARYEIFTGAAAAEAA